MITHARVTGHILLDFSRLVVSFLSLSTILSFCMYITANSYIPHFSVPKDSGNGWVVHLGFRWGSFKHIPAP